MSAYNCIHPQVVKTKHGLVKVACGHCAACINRKTSQLTTQCNIEAQKHRFVYFVTLTYADDYLPVCRVVRHLDRYVFVDVSRRDCVGDLCDHATSVMAVTHVQDFTDGFFNLYYKKLNLHPEYHGLIPYLSRRDYQLFLKRLRKNLSIKTNESIRYFLCGEYGPRHFRPHFHLILFTNSPAVADHLREAVSQSWHYGRIDFQASKGGCANYVSKYINSFSHLSKVQRLSHFRPFSAHSRFFAQSFFKAVAEKIEQVKYGDLIGYTIPVGNRYKQVFPWMALENNLLPRCYGYGSSDSRVRLFVYLAYQRCSKEYGETCVSTLATAMADSVWNGNPRPWVKEFCAIFRDYYQPSKLDQTFSSILYVSKKFIRLCLNFGGLSPSTLLSSIERYYSSKDYIGLCKQLQEQSDFVDQYGPDFRVFLLSWYSNFTPIRVRDITNYLDRLEIIHIKLSQPFTDKPYWRKQLMRCEADDPFKTYTPAIISYIHSLGLEPSFITDDVVEVDNPIYCNFVSMQEAIAQLSVKHKHLQDLNNIFCYGKYNDNEKRP